MELYLLDLVRIYGDRFNTFLKLYKRHIGKRKYKQKKDEVERLMENEEISVSLFEYEFKYVGFMIFDKNEIKDHYIPKKFDIKRVNEILKVLGGYPQIKEYKKKEKYSKLHDSNTI